MTFYPSFEVVKPEDVFDDPHPMLWSLFGRFKWFRMYTGGIWQMFDQSPIPNDPHYVWHRMKITLKIAVKTENWK